jgi:hypothetical protein
VLDSGGGEVDGDEGAPGDGGLAGGEGLNGLELDAKPLEEARVDGGVVYDLDAVDELDASMGQGDGDVGGEADEDRGEDGGETPVASRR